MATVINDSENKILLDRRVRIRIWRQDFFLAKRYKEKFSGCHISIELSGDDRHKNGTYISIKSVNGKNRFLSAQQTETLFNASPIAMVDFYTLDVKAINDFFEKLNRKDLEIEEISNECINFLSPLIILCQGGFGKFVKHSSGIPTKVLAAINGLMHLFLLIKGHGEPSSADEVLHAAEMVTERHEEDPLEKILQLTCDNVVSFIRQLKQKEIEYSGKEREVWDLWEAAAKGQPEKVKVIVQRRNVDPNWENFTLAGLFSGSFFDSGRYTTPLLIATKYGHVSVVKVLTSCPDIEINTPMAQYTNETPLILACRNGSIEIFRLLLNKDKHCLDQFYPRTVNIPYSVGLLLEALSYSKFEIAKEILDTDKINNIFKFLAYINMFSNPKALSMMDKILKVNNRLFLQLQAMKKQIAEDARSSLEEFNKWLESYERSEKWNAKDKILEEIAVIKKLAAMSKSKDNQVECIHIYQQLVLLLTNKKDDYITNKNPLHQELYKLYQNCCNFLVNSINNKLQSQLPPEENAKPPKPLDDIEEALNASKNMNNKNQGVGPREIAGWEIINVLEDGNCFYSAVADQLILIDNPLLKSIDLSTTPSNLLRLRVQGKDFKDGEWADHPEILKLSKELKVIVAIVDTRNPNAGFVYHYVDSQETAHFTINEKNLPKLPVVKIAYTGNHYLSVRKHPIIGTDIKTQTETTALATLPTKNSPENVITTERKIELDDPSHQATQSNQSTQLSGSYLSCDTEALIFSKLSAKTESPTSDLSTSLSPSTKFDGRLSIERFGVRS